MVNEVGEEEIQIVDCPVAGRTKAINGICQGCGKHINYIEEIHGEAS